ncbi:alpha/beta fold hydrolase [Mycoplana dimorpha]|uniref:Pimeloyl-ACP methyl ester carboxylesterase n=2 Tax=Mycoplana dimorpha TaxID=28320 RepID=A0A2T5BI91_MYCDI|nr:pimeloyl-ACP methyl ester carboxylesterase [Mycoplana dimorpha]
MFDEHQLPAPDGLLLYARDYRSRDPAAARRTPVVCLAGLSRNCRDFHPLASLIAAGDDSGRRVITLDYRGRGRSAWDGEKANYNLSVECSDVLAVMTALGIDRAAFIGTSRGGLILHLLAATRPEAVAAVVLNDIGPVIEAEGLREIARYLGGDERPRSWDEAAGILRKTHGAAFPALTDADWQDMARAIYAERDGRIVADFDPAIAAQLRTLDLSRPLPDLWPQFDAFRAMPLMAIRGEHSRLLSAETFAAMATRQPHLRGYTARGQGHAPLLHKPDVFTALLDFLRDV